MAVICFIIEPKAFADDKREPFFVLDEAQVLSAELEEDINEKGQTIFLQSGCRFAVAVVDFLGGKSIEQYSRDIYLKNEMGDNGVLLVVSVAEENYHIIQGEALKSRLSDAVLKEILDKKVEQSFQDGEYQKAVSTAYQSITEELEDIYSITSDRMLYEKQLKEIELANQKTAETKKLYYLLLTAAVLASILFLIRMTVSFYYLSRRRR